MRMRQRLAAVTLIGGLTTLGIGLTAGVAGANVVTDCQSLIGSVQSGSLHLTSTPAAGSSVPVGSTITVSSAWTKGDFNETDRLTVCGTVGGAFNAAMSSQDKSVGNDGSATTAVTVPADAPAGSQVCLVAGLNGMAADAKTPASMVSDGLCYTAAAVVTTTTAAPTTTTTAAPTVAADPVNTNAGTTSAPAVEAPVVAGNVAQAPAPMPVLPRTGSGVDRLAGFGAIALAVGGLTRFVSRKRPAEA
jgi:hypothetical protein